MELTLNCIFRIHFMITTQFKKWVVKDVEYVSFLGVFKCACTVTNVTLSLYMYVIGF